MVYLRIIFCVSAIGCCAASQPAPEVTAPAPLAVKNGQTIEVTLTGQHIKTLQSVTVLNPRGVTAAFVEAPRDDQLRLKISAAPDAVIGQRQLRVLGPAGVLRPIQLFVSSYDVELLGASDQPHEIRLPATFTGQIATAGQLQQIRFQGHKQELLIFDVSARRSGSPLEAVITIQSDSGRQLPCKLEHHGGDPLIVFTPPEDGDYLLRLRDLRYRGGAEFGFRVTAGHVPYLESVLPGSGKPGTVIRAKPIGYNLDDAPPVAIDLTHSAPGQVSVHATAALGTSNDIPFEVTDLPQLVESEPNDSPEEANVVALPIEISGSTDRAADEDFFRFRLPYKQPVSLEVLSARLGSPMVPLLQLRSAKGDVIEANDGTADSDARIIRDLDAGEYIASVRDLAFSGGPGHWYRLRIEPARSLQPDFTLRFQSDAPRLHRGGSVAIWFDVGRINGLRGDISLTPESLPPGVTVSPLVLPENGSGWLALSAAMDAPLGTVPLRLVSQASIGMTPVVHEAQAGAYLTVLDSAPFTLETTANLTPQQIDGANARIGLLSAKLSALSPDLKSNDPARAELRNQIGALRSFIGTYGEVARLQAAMAAPSMPVDAGQKQWEHSILNGDAWTVLQPQTMMSDAGTPLNREADGSVIAAASNSSADVYHISGSTPLKALTAVRLEALPDPRLPANGPGQGEDGSFVLTGFDIDQSTQKGTDLHDVQIARARATAELSTSPVSSLIGADMRQWSAGPGAGLPVEATFFFDRPTEADAPSMLSITLPQAAKHGLGRFRLWVTSNVNPDAAERIPEMILAALKTPDAARSAGQKRQISDYYRNIAPSLAAVRERLAELRASTPAMPPRARRNQPLAIPVLIHRTDGFKAQVTVTLEGYVPGNPKMIAKQIKVTPLKLNLSSSFGLLNIQPEAAAEFATRMVVLKAEAKVGDDVITQYSPAFPLTIQAN